MIFTASDQYKGIHVKISFHYLSIQNHQLTVWWCFKRYHHTAPSYQNSCVNLCVNFNSCLNLTLGLGKNNLFACKYLYNWTNFFKVIQRNYHLTSLLSLESFLCRCSCTKNQKHHPQPWRRIGSTTAAALPFAASLPRPFNAAIPPSHSAAIISPASFLLQPSVHRFLHAWWGGWFTSIHLLQMPPPNAASSSPLLPPIDIGYIKPKRWGEGEYFVSFAWNHTRNSPRNSWRWGGCCSSADLFSQSCGDHPNPPPTDRYR